MPLSVCAKMKALRVVVQHMEQPDIEGIMYYYWKCDETQLAHCIDEMRKQLVANAIICLCKM
jgi:hypothetical protein